MKSRYYVKSAIQSMLLGIIAVICVKGDYVWMVFRADGHKEIIQKANFTSFFPLGYGMVFPMIFFILTVTLLLITVKKTVWINPQKNDKTLRILGILNLVLLVSPILLGMLVFNIGIGAISILFIFYLSLNYLGTGSPSSS